MEKEQYKKYDKNNFLSLLRDLQKEYTNGEPRVDDEFFDYLVDFYENKFNDKFDTIGFIPENNQSKVNLEYYMPSLDKVKESDKTYDNKINNFKKKNPGGFFLIDKLDGCSIQLTITKDSYSVFTRGDGEVGSDVSKIYEYLKIPKIKFNKKFDKIVIRGEIVMSNENFMKYLQTHPESKKSRTTVGGFINSASRNSKKINLEDFKLLDFISYDIQYYYQEITQIEKLNLLLELGFKVAHYEIDNTNLESEFLKKYLLQRRIETEYDIDGIVIVSSDHISLPKLKEENKNPDYKIAYKLDTFIEAEVIDIEWIPSKSGFIIPTVIIKEIELLGSYINRATGKNSKFILENKIGKGSKIIITLGGDIIPNIVSVVKSSKKSDMILPDESITNYEMNETGVHYLVSNNENRDVIIAKFDYFLKHMKVESIGKTIIGKLYDSGITTFLDLFTITQEKLSLIDRLGEKNSKKIYDNLHSSLNNCELFQIMNASCVFGGFGEKKIKLIIDNIPNVLEYSDKVELKEKIIEIKGFSDTTADIFVNNLENFKTFLKNHPQINILKDESESYSEKEKIKIVLTGFTKFNEEINNKLKENGYVIDKSVSKSTKYLVVKDENSLKGKAEKAQKYGITIIFYEDFIKLL
jgi:DNA ligase (NAD+)